MLTIIEILFEALRLATFQPARRTPDRRSGSTVLTAAE